MKKAEVKIGSTYVAKVSGKLAHVRILGENLYGGWNAVNVATKRDVHIRGAQRLRREILPANRLEQIRSLRAAGMTYEAARDQVTNQEFRENF
jgi:hypothetical protein